MRANEFIRKLRLDMGLTLEKISKETGIPASTISTWERGGALPKGKNLRIISDFFGFPPDSLNELSAMEKTEPKASLPGFRKIPVVSWTTAGHATSFEDLANQNRELRKMLAECAESLEQWAGEIPAYEGVFRNHAKRINRVLAANSF